MGDLARLGLHAGDAGSLARPIGVGRSKFMLAIGGGRKPIALTDIVLMVLMVRGAGRPW